MVHECCDMMFQHLVLVTGIRINVRGMKKMMWKSLLTILRCDIAPKHCVRMANEGCDMML